MPLLGEMQGLVTALLCFWPFGSQKGCRRQIVLFFSHLLSASGIERRNLTSITDFEFSRAPPDGCSKSHVKIMNFAFSAWFKWLLIGDRFRHRISKRFAKFRFFPRHKKVGWARCPIFCNTITRIITKQSPFEWDLFVFILRRFRRIIKSSHFNGDLRDFGLICMQTLSASVFQVVLVNRWCHCAAHVLFTDCHLGIVTSQCPMQISEDANGLHSLSATEQCGNLEPQPKTICTKHETGVWRLIVILFELMTLWRY